MSDNKDIPQESLLFVYAGGVKFPKGVYWFDILASMCLDLPKNYDFISEELYNILLDFRYCHTRIRTINIGNLEKEFKELRNYILLNKSKFINKLDSLSIGLDSEQILSEWIKSINIIIELSKCHPTIDITRPLPSDMRENLITNSKINIKLFNEIIHKIESGEDIEDIVK